MLWLEYGHSQVLNQKLDWTWKTERIDKLDWTYEEYVEIYGVFIVYVEAVYGLYMNGTFSLDWT